jgi:hypothetical protein
MLRLEFSENALKVMAACRQAVDKTVGWKKGNGSSHRFGQTGRQEWQECKKPEY